MKQQTAVEWLWNVTNTVKHGTLQSMHMMPEVMSMPGQCATSMIIGGIGEGHVVILRGYVGMMWGKNEADVMMCEVDVTLLRGCNSLIF